MKNAIFWALVGIVAVILGLLGYGIYLTVTHASAFDVATAACAGFLLVGSLVVWEVLMKPGFYWRRRETTKGDEEPPTENEESGGRPPLR